MSRVRNAVTALNTAVATETVVAVILGLTTKPGDVIDIEGALSMVAGAGTTAIVVRIRRGVDATGALLGGSSTITLAAGNRGGATICVSDAPPESQNLSYVLTVQQTGGTAAGTVDQGSLSAIWGV